MTEDLVFCRWSCTQTPLSITSAWLALQVIRSCDGGSRLLSMVVHPDPSQHHLCMVGSQNKKAIQFDFNSGEVVTEYRAHLGAVSTVSICDDGKRVITTSDDRKMFVWNYGLPNVEKVGKQLQICRHVFARPILAWKRIKPVQFTTSARDTDPSFLLEFFVWKNSL